MSWPWSELGLDGPAGLPEIRRAYAQRLKTTHPEDDPEGFQRLHSAYQEASRHARRSARAAASSAPPTEPAKPAERSPKEPPEARDGPDWDYDELLKEPKSSPLSPEEADSPPAEAPRPPERLVRDWDYERLFAEGEAEAQEVRRRKLKALRRKNRARYAPQDPEGDGEEVWSSVCAASRALELLYAGGAPLSQWRRFLASPAFWNVRANLDFVFALEDFLEQHPDLSPEIRKAIFAAYGFEKGPGYPVYKRLYRLLNVDRREKRRMARASSAWRTAWRSYPRWRKALIVILFSILAAFFLLGIGVSVRDACRDYTERREAKVWKAQSLEWLEEDFGRSFFHPLGQYPEICAPAEEPALYFWVQREGQRTERSPGYRTNYPHVLLKQELESFAERWELGLRFDSAGEGYQGKPGEAPGAYLFDLPLVGAGESITALGALLEDLKGRDWYQVFEDRYGGQITYQIFLCHGDLSFYDAVSTQGGGFDAAYARAQYETQVGPAFCRYILEESGLAARHMGEDYVLLDQGMAEIEGTAFFQVAGADKESREPRVRYLMATGGRMLFCLPEDELSGVGHITDLYRGALSHEDLDGVGMVMIWDHVDAS